MELRTFRGSALFFIPLGIAVSVWAGVTPARPEPFFDQQVRPILQTHCASCHGGEKKVKGGLNLTSRELLLEGGNNGPAIDLDHPADSLLLQAVEHTHRKIKMPSKKLPQAKIDVLARWVKQGAPWGDGPLKVHGPPPVDAQARNFWSFRPVVRPEVPAVKNAAWTRNPIDAFILAKLEAAGMAPSPIADRGALLRRLSYDLIGLPPTPEEVAAVLRDESPDWYEKIVDRLLASPHYGEHWGRHWLDLVRYAETNSFERDGPKANVWRYRDYVIDSFNRDKPYDQFLREQLAGDELEQVTPETIIATGYYRLGIWDDEPADRTQSYYDQLDDIAATTGQVFLGLTVNCARCHDHKIDPFPQKDYYRLLAFFHGIRSHGNGPESQRPIGNSAENEKFASAVAVHRQRLAKINDELREIEDGVRPHLGGGERDDFRHDPNKEYLVKRHMPLATYDRFIALRRLRGKLDRQAPRILAQALCVTENGATPQDTFVLQRGNYQARGEKVQPGFPSVITTETPATAQPTADRKSSGRRRVLANWLASPTNPLTARVMANRLWQYHFGRGIVRSSNDFGYQGNPPTHPELLDWLASEFVARGWSMKQMHRLILTSNAYRMSARPEPSALAKDPENNLLWRFSPRRLTAEELRDSILAVCGNLNLKQGGPSIHPTIPQEVLDGQSIPGNGWDLKCPPEERSRRSVYVHVKRSLALPILSAFDAADTDGSCPVRFTTTQPTQALGMLNGQFVNEQAGVFAAHVRKKAEAPEAQVRLIVQRVTQREPTAREIERGVKFLERMAAEPGSKPEEALRRFCLLALNLNEFVYVD